MEMKTLKEWKYVDFVWNNSKHKEQAINSGNYNVNACVLYDVDRAPDGEVFVTAVRDKGVPASLMTVSKITGPGGPLLHPYPNWSWYENNNCNDSIISVFRVHIKCNHLFVLDSGKIGDEKICCAKLLIFDLSSNMLIKQVIIPDNIASNKNGAGLLVTPVVYSENCESIATNAIVYMADILGYGLVTWNASKLCRFESECMKPTVTMFTIENQNFSLDDGILGLTLVKDDLYYTALSGDNMCQINTRALQEFEQNCELNTNKINHLTVKKKLTGQTAPIASKDNAIFFSNIPQTSIMCADAYENFYKNPNTHTNLESEVIAKDAERLQFPSGMKVISIKEKMYKYYYTYYYTNENYLWMLTNRFQRVITDTLNTNETNFRILSINLEEVKEHTKCFDSCSYNHNWYNWHYWH